MTPIRELNPLENLLLMDAKRLGACVPKNDEQKVLISRLQQEGYVRPIPHPHPEPGQPPAFSYRLTPLGEQLMGAKR
jgi:hypothetical protein